MKKLVITLILPLAAAIAGKLKLDSWASAPVALNQDVVLEFKRGMGLVALSEALENQGLITQASWFQLWVRLGRDYRSYKAGKYIFQNQVSPEDIEAKLIRAEIYRPLLARITIPEGFTLEKIISRLAANNLGDKSRFLQLVSDRSFLDALKVPSKNLEGYLYPATYDYFEPMTERRALALMVQTFFRQVPEQLIDQAKAKGLSLHEFVTMASLIEMETIHDSEKPQIAEVIWRRLKRGEPLGIDAAIIYGIQDYDGDIKWKHLRDAKNPYNTRIHKGLPPTPIGSPSRSSFEAVLNPTHNGYHYYVLKPGSDRHHFSKTLSEHNRHVKLLIKASRTRNQ